MSAQRRALRPESDGIVCSSFIAVPAVGPHCCRHTVPQTSEDKHVTPVEILYWQGKTDRSVSQMYATWRALGRKLHGQEE